MARKKINKEVVKEIERLHDAGLTHQKVADVLGVGKTTVERYVRKYKRELLEVEKYLTMIFGGVE